MKQRSLSVILSALFGIIYLLFLYYVFSNIFSNSTSEFETLGAAIGFAFIYPHIAFVFLAIIFNFVAYFSNQRWAALTGAILYCVSMICMPLYALFVIFQTILSFVGFANLKKINEYDDDDEDDYRKWKNKYCVYCNKKRGFFESFNKYGFCKDCVYTVRTEITKSLEIIKNAVYSYDPNNISSEISHYEAIKLIDDALNLIDVVEQKRLSVPFFKSSTNQYKIALKRYKEHYKNEENKL